MVAVYDGDHYDSSKYKLVNNASHIGQNQSKPFNICSTDTLIRIKLLWGAILYMWNIVKHPWPSSITCQQHCPHVTTRTF